MKLAVIGQIAETQPIPGADRIHLASVVCGDAGRWSGVVGKDIGAGDRVTVFLQDAVLPDNDPRWSFMERHKWRVCMARFKGVPSECVIIPGAPDLAIGTDLAESLGVTKHEKPVPAAIAGDVRGNFPSFIPKTDEDNFQRVPHLVERLATDPWYATEKADGTSCTVWNDEDGMHVCSRNLELKEFSASGAGNVYWRAARKYELDRLPRGLVLQFEVVGPGIQANPLGLADLEVRAFTLHDIERRQRCPAALLWAQCAELDIPLSTMVKVCARPERLTADQLRALAEIRYPNGQPGEGIVIRAFDSSWSFKVINLLYKESQ